MEQFFVTQPIFCNSFALVKTMILFIKKYLNEMRHRNWSFFCEK